MPATCAICGYKSVSDAKMSIGIKYSYIVCSHCKGANLDPIPSVEELTKIYQTTKYYRNLSVPVKDRVIQYLITRKITSSPAEWVVNKFRTGKILDVGCGNGDFLFELKKLGWSVTGIDISGIAVKTSGSKVNQLNVRKGDFLRLKFKERFYLISFWHVLEHIKNPEEYLKRSSKLLSADGKVIGEVPNFDSLWLKLFGCHYNWIMVPEHILYFSKQTLKLMLHDAGFNNVEVYCPPRGLLNFSLSMNKFVLSKKIPLIFCQLFFLASIPLSIILGVALSIIDKGEVLRFAAQDCKHATI